MYLYCLSLSLSLSLSLPRFPSFHSFVLSFYFSARSSSSCSRGEIDIISNVGGTARDEQQEGEGCQGGGSGVLQREIPSITPWASYIRDYFSFLSPHVTHHHLHPLAPVSTPLSSSSCLPFFLSFFLHPIFFFWRPRRRASKSLRASPGEGDECCKG